MLTTADTTHDYQEIVRALWSSSQDIKPWTIELLARQGELNRLEHYVLEFDETCLETLKAIALRADFGVHAPKHVLRNNRNDRPASIDEACYRGSQAAWLLVRYKIVKAEHDRLLASQRAERMRDNATNEMDGATCFLTN